MRLYRTTLATGRTVICTADHFADDRLRERPCLRTVAHEIQRLKYGTRISTENFIYSYADDADGDGEGEHWYAM